MKIDFDQPEALLSASDIPRGRAFAFYGDRRSRYLRVDDNSFLSSCGNVFKLTDFGGGSSKQYVLLPIGTVVTITT